MNNKEFISELSRRSDHSFNETQTLVNNIISEMKQCFGEGKNIAVPGFGNFEIRKKMERVIVNPTTRQRMLIPPKLVLAFRPSTKLKEKTKSKN